MPFFICRSVAVRCGCWMKCSRRHLPNKVHRQFRSISSVIDTSKWEVSSPLPDLKIPDITLHDYLWGKTNEFSHLTAVECIESGDSYTYGELREICSRVSAGLRSLLGPGDEVGIVLPNMIQFVVAFISCLQAGIPVSFYNPQYTSDELTYQLDRVNPKLLICDPAGLQKVTDTSRRTKTKFSVLCTKDVNGQSASPMDGVGSFEDLYQSTPGQNHTSIDLKDIKMIFFSGGTTGLPKPVGHTHSSISALIEQLTHPKLSPSRRTSGNCQEIVPVILPMFHMYANIMIMGANLAQGAKLVLLPKFSYNGFVKTIQKSKPTVLYFVPPLIFMTGTSDDITQADMKDVRSIVTAAASCSIADMERLQQKAPIPISQLYGCTEAGIVSGTEVNVDSRGSIGIVYPNSKIKVLDTSTKSPLPPNTEGELVYTGPQRSQGYVNNPDATAEIMDSEGWVHSGDVGYYNEEGVFFVTDRIKDVMKVKGFQVSPSELEGVLRQCPGVLEAGVVGVPDPKAGEVPVAVLSVDKANAPTIAQLEDFTKQRLISYKKISKFIFVDEVPKTMSGKILRREIRKMLGKEQI